MAWLAPVHAIDVVLAVVAVEAAVLLVLGRTGRSPLAPRDVVGQLAAGAFLLAALRAALSGAGAGWTLLLVTCSLPAHLWDLARRWRAARGRAP